MPPSSRPPRQAPPAEPASGFTLDEGQVFDRDLDKSADDFLTSEPQLGNIFNCLADGPTRGIDSAADRVRKVTRTQHHKALAFAYAVWLRSSTSRAAQIYIAKLGQTQKGRNKRITNLHLLVRDIIRYGDEGGDAKTDHRRLHSRDVAAIRYLHISGIGPANLEDVASRPGEGLDAWSKKWPGLKRQREGAPAPAPIDAPPTIEITIRSVDGAIEVSRERFTIADNERTRALIAQLRDQRMDLEQGVDHANVAVNQPAASTTAANSPIIPQRPRSRDGSKGPRRAVTGPTPRRTTRAER